MAAQERAEVLTVVSKGRPVVATRCTRTFRVHDVHNPGQTDRSDSLSGEDRNSASDRSSIPESHARDRLIRETEVAVNRGIFAVTDIQSINIY